MTVSEKIAALRAALRERSLAACIIPTGDPHQSEYAADHWNTRQWISGFTGSAGTAIVTADHAGVWTDSRYFIQAERQLNGSGVELHRLNVPHTAEHLDWMKENLPPGSKVGLDGRMFSVGSVRRIAKHFHEKKIDLDTSADLAGGIWKNRPPLPQGEVFEHDVKFAGVSREQKLQAVRGKMEGADFYLVSTLDDICWLLNLRGSDVECNPVFYAYAVVGKEVAHLFIEKSKVPEGLKEKLNADGVIVKPYQEVEAFLKNLPDGASVLLDMGTTSNQLYNSIDSKKVKEGENIVANLKAVKNPVEIQHIRNVMVKDGAALVRLFRWLESALAERPVPETEVAEKLVELRRAQGNYFGESFNAIVGFNANGAMVHYRPEVGRCALIERQGILLLDSGGQYLDGTTDITRTVALGEPSEEQKRDFTLVLKAHVALATAKFPHGTAGIQLDALARAPLWQQRLNYGHGTGHGVGFFLNVHEPPQAFTPTANNARAGVALEPGMLTSNEPGLYREGRYGIRTENLVLCAEDGAGEQGGKFCRFETVTLFPVDLNLIEKNLLTEDEKAWLNAYHEEVFEKISPLLNEAEAAWLAEKCGKI